MRCLKTRVFICSWGKPKYPRQELCCCYYCLISLSPGRISGSLPGDGWNHQSLVMNLLDYLLPVASAHRPFHQSPTIRSCEEAAAEAHHQALCVLTAAWLSNTTSVSPLRCHGHGGNDAATDTYLWSGEFSQTCPVPHYHEYATCHEWQVQQTTDDMADLHLFIENK